MSDFEAGIVDKLLRDEDAEYMTLKQVNAVLKAIHYTFEELAEVDEVIKDEDLHKYIL